MTAPNIQSGLTGKVMREILAILMVVLVISIVVGAVAFFAIMVRHDREQAELDELGLQIAKKFEHKSHHYIFPPEQLIRDSDSMLAKPKLIIYDLDTKRVAHSIQGRLPEHLRASSPEEANTIVWVQRTSFSYKDLMNTSDGVEPVFTVWVIDKNSKVLIAEWNDLIGWSETFDPNSGPRRTVYVGVGKTTKYHTPIAEICRRLCDLQAASP